MEPEIIPTRRQKFGRFLRRHWLKVLIALIVLFPILSLIIWLAVPKQPEVITALAERGDLVQSVEAVGEVISEKDLDLKFPVTGVVSEVLVKEGDEVEAGAVLAKLRNNSEQADVNSAWANYQAARAELRAIEEGSRPEDIAISEAELQNKRASLAAAQASLQTAEENLLKAQAKLEDLRQEATVSLAGHIGTSRSTLTKQLTAMENALFELDDIFDTPVVKNNVEFHVYRFFENYERSNRRAKGAINTALRFEVTDFQSALEGLNEARSVSAEAIAAANDAYRVLVQTPESQTFSHTVKETNKDDVGDQRDAIQTALSAIESQLKTLQDASANLRTKIAAEEAAVTTSQGQKDNALADIRTFETSVSIGQAQLDLKVAGARQADKDAARARSNRAYAEYERAKARLDDTVLIAPIAGRITKANLKVGEFTGAFEDFDRAITMLGESPYRIEIYASEIDIPKIAYTQTGILTLDAYPGEEFALSVTEIDPAATLVDGVPKYRVKLDFVGGSPEETFKIGMTGDVDILTASRADVVYVPGRAVLYRETGDRFVRILVKGDIEERDVRIGMETDVSIEIVEGVGEGEVVVVLVKE